MRKNIVAGNWKMNLNSLDGFALVNNVLSKISSKNNTEVILAPSFIHLYKIGRMCINIPNVFVASQDCSSSKNGAFTGEVSAEMIASCGARYVILGHSERRINFRETDSLLRLKVEQVLANNLEVIFCCGESLEQREEEVYFDCIKSQLFNSLFHLSRDQFSRVVIAYEPIWAIGTGVTATSIQAQEMHAFIRDMISKKYGNMVANNTSILYGGSCNSSNASELFSQKDIDGGLIGGASLLVDDFIEIINSF